MLFLSIVMIILILLIILLMICLLRLLLHIIVLLICIILRRLLLEAFKTHMYERACGQNDATAESCACRWGDLARAARM